MYTYRNVYVCVCQVYRPIQNICVCGGCEVEVTPRGLVSHIKIQMYLRQTANGVYKIIGHVSVCLSQCVCVCVCVCVSRVYCVFVYS